MRTINLAVKTVRWKTAVTKKFMEVGMQRKLALELIDRGLSSGTWKARSSTQSA